MAQKRMTIEELARMINEGFNNTATTEDIKGVNARLDRIETLLMEEQKRDIADLKARVKRLEDTLYV